MPQRLAKRLLIVGWDAADWKLIDALLAQGRMPNIKRLIDAGVRGDLRTLDPALSPLLWTSIATGKRADKHGILNFVEPDPSGQALRLSTSTSRQTKALWNILTQQQMRTNVVGWYATHPAEPINGVLVSNLFYEGMPQDENQPWPMVDECVHPSALSAQIADLRMHPAEIDPRELTSFVPDIMKADLKDRRLHLLAKLVAQAASIQNIATWLLENGEPADCTMVFNEAIDVVGHHFMPYFPPKMSQVSQADFERYQHVMFGIYQLQDMMLGRLLDLAGPETTVLLLSDHGFHSDNLRPPTPPQVDDALAAMDASWHRPLGVVVMAGPGIASGKQIHGATLLDIAPTVLTLLGLPVGADMDGRVLVEALDHAVDIDRVFSWDSLPGEAGQHPADKQVNPFDAQQSIRQLIDLGYLAALPEDVQAQLDMVHRETQFNLAIVKMSSAQVPVAADIFAELFKHNPAEPRYAINLSQCQYQLGRFAEARATLETFLQHHPNHPDAQIYLGAAMIAEGKLDEAVAVLEKANAHPSVAPERDCLLGLAFVLTRRLDDAKTVYERALAADPHSVKARYGLAQVALQKEQFEDAAEHALEAVQLQHFFPEGHYALGVALTFMGEYDPAIQCLQIAVSMQPGYLDAHRYLASIYRHRGDITNARKHRLVVEDLMARQSAGDNIKQSVLDEPPMGPAEWMRRVGLKPE